MTLLKNDGSLTSKKELIKTDGIGLGIKDGWHFGIGFGLAMTIAVPFILLLLGCVVGIGLVFFGNFW